MVLVTSKYSLSFVSENSFCLGVWLE